MKNLTAILIFISVFFTHSSLLATEVPTFEVTGDYSALSKYTIWDASVPGDVTLDVHPDVIQYFTNNELAGWVAQLKVDGSIVLHPITDSTDSTVSTNAATEYGVFVVVGTDFINNPVVTGWNKSLNYGFGGADPQGMDAIGDIMDNDPNSPYRFDTSKYWLFSENEFNWLNAPSALHEMYIGETYSVYKPYGYKTIFNEKVMAQTGYPVLHINAFQAEDLNSPMSQQVRENIPAYQIVHGQVISHEPNKGSLATFILPPFWNKAGEEYDVIFNAFYDHNQNTFKNNGPIIMDVMAKLTDSGVGKSIGVLFNGGGSLGGVTVQKSAYDNCAKLFRDYSPVYHMDAQSVLMYGWSRGAAAAMHLGANPYYPDDYKVKFIVGNAVPTQMGTHAIERVNYTYAGLFPPMELITGFKYSYHTNWKHPEWDLPARNLFMYIFTGEWDPAIVNEKSPISDLFMNRYLENGTNISFNQGSHDYAIPIDLSMEWIHKARDLGVPVEFNLGYKFGHQYPIDINAKLVEYMTYLIEGNDSPGIDGDHHYRPNPDEDEDPTKPGIEFYPEEQPIFAELPVEMIWGENNDIQVATGPGVLFYLEMTRINQDKWNNEGVIERLTEPGQGILLSVAQVPTLEDGGRNLNVTRTMYAPQESEGLLGFYVYDLYYQDAAGEWNWVSDANHPQWKQNQFKSHAVVEFKSAPNPLESATQYAEDKNRLFIGWGLISDF
jgi:hypothetical protein